MLNNETHCLEGDARDERQKDEDEAGDRVDVSRPLSAFLPSSEALPVPLDVVDEDYGGECFQRDENPLDYVYYLLLFFIVFRRRHLY